MKYKISLGKLKGVPRTLLIPLRGRYLETKRDDGIINDPKSVEIIDSLDHDFDESELPWDGQLLISVRTEILDEAIRSFLDENPDSVVVNLGCGLDTRVHRVDNGTVHWYDLDLPDTIEIRKKFFEENRRYKFIAKSVHDFAWMDEIEKNKKTLFIAEGLFNYFTGEQVKDILLTIKSNFPSAEIVFEAYSRLMKWWWHRHRHVRKAVSMFKWGVGTGKKLERWDSGIKFIQEWHYIDRHTRRWRWMRYFRHLQPLRKLMKVVHLRFGAGTIISTA